MFEKYTEKARRAIFFARYEASQFGSPTIDTEHLLLGVVREDRVLAMRFMPGRAEDAIRATIEREKGVGKKTSTSVDMPLSDACKRILGYAVEEAERLAQKHLGTEHLLLGLLHPEDTLAGRILGQFGLKLEDVREKLAAPSGEAEEAFTFAKRRVMTLAEFGADLTQQATADDFPPLIGRDLELEQLIRVLCCRGRRNAVLVGEPGVGKRALVRGLARRIADGNVPGELESKSIVMLDLAVIVSGLESRRLFEENLENLLRGMRYQGAPLLFFIDELHSLALSEPQCLQLANVLKAGMLKRSIQCISTATLADYEKAAARERWLEQLFQTVEIEAPDQVQTLEILRGTKDHYEKFHEVQYTDEALQYAVFHSHNYILHRNLPEKAIDLIDEAAAHVKIRRQPLPQEIVVAQARLRFIARRMEEATDAHEYEKARFYSDEDRQEREKLKQLFEKHGIAGKQSVTRADIEDIVSQWTGIPLAAIRASRMPGE
ncbi:MAG: AAA family ATPase [Acidobacteriia bacterium]|nr:AAA family ATPase [Terriglobia bacterium]